jgi:hypothetical protein
LDAALYQEKALVHQCWQTDPLGTAGIFLALNGRTITWSSLERFILWPYSARPIDASFLETSVQKE